MKLMTFEERDNIDQRKCLYRCEAEIESSFMSIFTHKIVFKKLFILKETPCGYWIETIPTYQKKWVSKDGLRRFAHPTRKEALISFKRRKEKQIKILEARLSDVKDMLYQANKLDENTIEIELLQKELDDLRKSNKYTWNTYGSEMCSETMIKQEQALEDKIKLLKGDV